MGTGRFLKEKVEGIQIIAAEPRYGELVYGPAQHRRGLRARVVRRDRAGPAVSRSAPGTPVLRTRQLVEVEGIFAGFLQRGDPYTLRWRWRTRRSATAGAPMWRSFIADGGWKYLSTGAYGGTLNDGGRGSRRAALGLGRALNRAPRSARLSRVAPWRPAIAATAAPGQWIDRNDSDDTGRRSRSPKKGTAVGTYQNAVPPKRVTIARTPTPTPAEALERRP